MILFDLTSNRGDLISDQIISNFIKCPASALPSAGGSKFDNSALIDANFEKIRGFAPARHLMSFDIPPLMMLLQNSENFYKLVFAHKGGKTEILYKTHIGFCKMYAHKERPQARC